MHVGVVGLWHLGCVTAACLASAGHEVTACDPDRKVVDALKAGKPPIFEPGLEDLIARSKTLRFSADPSDLGSAEVVWVTFDTPVDEDDQADVDFVRSAVVSLFPHVADGALVLISSQVPVGTTASLERELAEKFPKKRITFGYTPENLRLGKAISVFTQPDRVVAGVRNPSDRDKVTRLLSPFTANIEWMSVESAEMAKHALNAFLALSVTFINEIAALCERVGADAKEVERALKTESRIGPKAYLGPGGAFAGGTLARDVAFLTDKGRREGLSMHLIPAIKDSNDSHRKWPQRRLEELVGSVKGQRIAIWGLTYKPGTDTLRRSSAVELCNWLSDQGAVVCAHDPAVRELPADLASHIELAKHPLDAARDAVGIVVATEWPDYREIKADEVVAAMSAPLVLDANRFLGNTLGADARIRYATVGRPV